MTTYEQRALEQLETAEFFRKSLAQVYEEKPYDPAMVGALNAGVKFALATAQVYATLATIPEQLEPANPVPYTLVQNLTGLAGHEIEDALARMERDRIKDARALADDERAGVWPC